MIAEEALLEGMIRTTHIKVRSQIMAGIERMEKAMGELYGATISVSFSAGYPAVTNDPDAAALAKEAARTVVGTDSVVAQAHPSLGGEDFAYYLEKVPGCLVRLGAAQEGRKAIPAHSPHFEFDEAVLPVGAAFLREVAV